MLAKNSPSATSVRVCRGLPIVWYVGMYLGREPVLMKRSSNLARSTPHEYHTRIPKVEIVQATAGTRYSEIMTEWPSRLAGWQASFEELESFNRHLCIESFDWHLCIKSSSPGGLTVRLSDCRLYLGTSISMGEGAFFGSVLMQYSPIGNGTAEVLI